MKMLIEQKPMVIIDKNSISMCQPPVTITKMQETRVIFFNLWWMNEQKKCPLKEEK